MTSGTARTAPLVLLRTWLLPLTVGAAAVGVHYALHVPAGPLPPPSPAQLEAEKKAADKKKKEEDARQRAEDKKAGKTKPRGERSGPRDLAYEPFRRPRPAHIIEQLWAYYEPLAFKREPVFEAWQTAHKPLLWQIVDATRHTSMPDSPAIEVATSECHTIRCRLTITAPTQESLVTEIAALKQLRLGADPLWHSIEAEAPVADQTKAGAPTVPPRFKAELTVSFTRDLPTIPEISLPGQGPLRVPSPPASTIPSGPSSTATGIPGAAPSTVTGIPGTAPSTSTASKSPTKPPKPPRSPKPAEPDPG
jgi:hypothetical protein